MSLVEDKSESNSGESNSGEASSGVGQTTVLSSLVRSLLETAVNRGLARLDPDTFKRMASLQGKVAVVRIDPAGQQFYLQFSEAGLELLDASPSGVDVTVSGTPLALVQLLTSTGTERGAFPADVTITGDVTVAEQIKGVFARLQVDWEEQLSHVIGDIAAHELARGARVMRDWSKHAAQTLLLDAGEYLAEEVRLVPARNEIDAFVTAVDVLRDDADRLEKRVARLQGRARPRA